MSSDNNRDSGCGCLLLLAIIIATRGAAIGFILALVVLYFIWTFIAAFFKALFRGASSGDSSGEYRDAYGDSSYSGEQQSGFGSSDSDTGPDYTEFLCAICRLCGYISRAGGNITKEQIDIVSKIIDQADPRIKIRKKLQDEFREGKSDGFDPYLTCKSIKSTVINDSSSANFILNLLLSLIFSDNVVTDLERQRLYQITDLLGINRAAVNSKFREFEFAYGYSSYSSNREERSYSYQERRSSGDESSSRSRQRSSSTSSQGISSRDDALRILGLGSGATAQDIKRAYLKLMKEYHPDRLKAKGITGSLKKEYEEKCKLITEAYNYLK